MIMCPADAVGCSDVAVVGDSVVEIVALVVVAAVIVGIFVFFALRRRQR